MTHVILIADDHAVHRRGLSEYLRTLFPDVRVVEAANGKEAVAAAKRETPALVLMDVRMPEMNGIEATRRIKAAMPDTKVVVLTLLDDTPTREAAHAAGADGYLVKGRNGTMEQVLRTFLDHGEKVRNGGIQGAP